MREGGFAARDLHASPVFRVLVGILVTEEVDPQTGVAECHRHSVLFAGLSVLYVERGALHPVFLRAEWSPGVRVVEILDHKEGHFRRAVKD